MISWLAKTFVLWASELKKFLARQKSLKVKKSYCPGQQDSIFFEPCTAVFCETDPWFEQPFLFFIMSKYSSIFLPQSINTKQYEKAKKQLKHRGLSDLPDCRCSNRTRSWAACWSTKTSKPSSSPRITKTRSIVQQLALQKASPSLFIILRTSLLLYNAPCR